MKTCFCDAFTLKFDGCQCKIEEDEKVWDRTVYDLVDKSFYSSYQSIDYNKIWYNTIRYTTTSGGGFIFS